MWIEIIGYIGMVLVLCSFLMKKIKWLRIVNCCGAVLSSIYGILTYTWPTAILNISLTIINVIYLIVIICKERRNEK